MKKNRKKIHARFTRSLCLCVLWFSASAFGADIPQWIWHDNHGAKAADGEVRYFRKTFQTTTNATKAALICAADDSMLVYLNGAQVADIHGWEKTSYTEVTANIRPGENVLAIRGKNDIGMAGIIVVLDMTIGKNKKQSVVTDNSWISATNAADGWTNLDFAADGWTRVESLGKAGVPPWGDIFNPAPATPATSFTLLPGFQAELIRSAQRWEGSWIAMTIDQRGRLIISPQEGTNNLLRVTLSRKGAVEKVETIDQPVGSAMGLLYAFGGLYVNGRGPEGLGIYRLHFDYFSDKFGAPKLVKKIEKAGGEHGSHAILAGPDKHLYVISGNFTEVPKDIAPDSPHRNYAEDQLLPRAEDGNGFGVGLKPPGGFVLRMDRDGKNTELFCAGMRNTYDFAFKPDGEMFGFDSDMEWDWGMPWYRPIRICHLVSGGDYGFREGTGKWPEYYPDSLPATVDVGIGSPTGMKFGTASNFPDKYKKALYALDWAYGRIFAVHFKPKGASYEATFETLLKGKPLNLTDLEFGKDGAMYFITGGRGTQSGLYRVSYVGPKNLPDDTAPTAEELKAGAAARAVRHKLEALQGKANPRTVDFAWPYLSSEDRWIRYAARIAIESQPVAQWQERALNETNANAGLTALLALARCGNHETQSPLLHGLAKFPFDGLSEEQKLAKLRIVELSFIRQGRPEPELAKFVMDKLDHQYPAKDEWLNRELCELLIYLEAPDVVAKTLALLDAAPTQEEQIHYLLHLRNLKTGWTMEQHEHYFNWLKRYTEEEAKAAPAVGDDSASPKIKLEKRGHTPEMLQWFADAGRGYSDGASFPKFMTNLTKDAMASLTDAERAQLQPVIADAKPAPPKAVVAPRKFVKDWSMADLQPDLDQVTKGRSFARGKSVFTAAQCIQCHRFGNEGGAVGPELTAISSRYSHRDILESILLPSKVISEQYQNTLVIKKNGDDITGRVVEENDQRLVLVTDALNGTKAEVLKSDIDTRQASRISPMPEGLVNSFTEEDILDLIAYLESGGKENAPAFQGK